MEYNAAEVSVTDIVKKVEQLGYKAIRKEEAAAEGDYKQKEIRHKKMQLAASAILSFPLLWAMVSHFSFTSWIYLPEFLMNPWVQLVLATPVQFIIGQPILRRGIQSTS